LVDLSIGYNAYMAKFSAKTRSTLKRKMRKFADLSGGEIGVLEFRTKDELTRFFPLARSVSAKTYQERLLGAGLPDTPAFAEYAASLAENGALRAYVLDLQGRPAAYLFLPIEHGRVVYAYLGYDPAVAQHSPGTVLQLAVMERLFAEPGLRLFDFTEGAGEHKELFSTHALPCVDVLLLKRGSRGVRVVRAHAAYSALEQRTVALADRLGLKARIKRLVRRLSAPAA
jgi:CelD/BcsL family acetyltransferase involved in cellulose biosynthesis